MIEVDEPVESDRIEELEYVDSFELVGYGPARFEYLLQMELPRCQETMEEQEGEFYIDGPLHLDEDGLIFTAIATQDALERVDEAFVGNEDIRPHLDVLRIGEYSGTSNRVETLTERQREVLTAAFEQDYFNVPRGVTADELAAEFDLDKSTVLEHLRRAERNVLERAFEPTGTELTL